MKAKAESQSPFDGYGLEKGRFDLFFDRKQPDFVPPLINGDKRAFFQFSGILVHIANDPVRIFVFGQPSLHTYLDYTWGSRIGCSQNGSKVKIMCNYDMVIFSRPCEYIPVVCGHLANFCPMDTCKPGCVEMRNPLR